MFKLRIILLALSGSFLILLSCQKTKFCPDEGEQQIVFGNGDHIMIPNCWQHNPLQGIDSQIGEIVYEEAEIFIRYDIGSSAGNYVDEETENIKVESSVNETFFYAKVDKNYLSSDDCCVFITFPDRGPANFITLKDGNLDVVLEIVKSFTPN